MGRRLPLEKKTSLSEYISNRSILPVCKLHIFVTIILLGLALFGIERIQESMFISFLLKIEPRNI